MSGIGFRKAERRKAKLRLGLVGPSGSGKTYSALLVAKGLGGKVALIDTENGSGELYAHLTDYDVCTLEPPYTVQKYLAAIEAAEQAGYDVVIIDSLSHAWAGQGGILEQVDARKGRGNDFTAWRDVTPWHNKLIDAMLQSKCHVVATMRSKTAYEMEKDERGKVKPVKVGLAPVQREGMDYEFTVVLELDQQRHMAQASKDRTSLFDGQVFLVTESTGAMLRAWLEEGDDAPSPTPQNKAAEATEAKGEVLRETPPSQRSESHERAASSADVDGRFRALYGGYLEVCGGKHHAVNAMRKATGVQSSEEMKNERCLKLLEDDLHRRRDALAKKAAEGDPLFFDPSVWDKTENGSSLVEDIMVAMEKEGVRGQLLIEKPMKKDEKGDAA
jgi:hypothetical protein